MSQAGKATWVALALGAIVLTMPSLAGAPQDAKGIAPVGADGRPLNLDFEKGSLADWTAEGEAFEKQPVKGDTVAPRRGDMKSGHSGDYWIGTFEVAGDAPKGTLTSRPFKVTHRWASFKVAGGSHDSTAVEIVSAGTKKVIVRVSGENREELRPVVISLRPHIGKEIFIRLVDDHSGGWGHINFDHFRFHARPPRRLPRQRDPNAGLAQDAYKFSGVGPEESVRIMTLPEGFKATLFAGEPDVRQPIAMALDERGRVWVVQNFAYPVWRSPDRPGPDTILVFEDTDGDGKFDTRKVFAEGLNFVTGLEVGFGGVWVGAPPYLLFIPDKDGDDVPDGKPQILLDGWGHQDTHETLNSFIWGPDGWLYGCHGVFTHSNVGKPGATPEQRKRINAGYWRYHPLKHRFEVFAEGTSNPWGIDFNEYGQAFATACVIPHLYHVIQGARYRRQAGNHFNPHTYADIQTIADHFHWLGARGPHAGNNKSDSAGGGHAHCGAMIYLGDNWPAEHRNQLFVNNIHGQRVNNDLLERKGSGYVGRHGRDFLLSNDRSSQILNLRYGPDGGVTIIDWYDRQACHTRNPKQHDRSNGRIYKVSYGDPRPVTVDVAKLDDNALVELMLRKNDWYVRHGRKVLQQRRPGEEIQEKLATIAFTHEDPTRNLRGLWALHVTGGLTNGRILKGLEHAREYVRAWTIQLATEDGAPSVKVREKFAEMAKSDASPVVRLYLASAVQRFPLDQRDGILEGLLAHAEDAGDHNLPLMYWYAVEPVVSADVKKGAVWVAKCRIPRVRQFIARRIAAGN